MRIDLADLNVRFGEVGVVLDGAAQVNDGALVRETIAQVPGQLRARQIGFREVWIDRKGLLDLDEGLAFQRRIAGVVKELLGVSAGQPRVAQREVRIERHRPFKLEDTVAESR